MNAVERGVVLARSEYLDVPDLRINGEPAAAADEPLAGTDLQLGPLEQVEMATILKTLDAVQGNKSEAARQLGITRKTLHKKLKSYGVMK